jgi:hypothetical protein
MSARMSATSAAPTPSLGCRARVRGILLKGLRLLAVGVLFGWAYVWVAPKVYRPASVPGFWIGAVHGAIMPIALPSLLVGQDVPIYAAHNSGRTYKLGYIAGINVCGFLFFGLSFWQPAALKPSRNAPLNRATSKKPR